MQLQFLSGKVEFRRKRLISTARTGSTPGCGYPVDEFKQLDELHPGNYCFYDYCQETLGSCKASDISAFVLSRVNSVFESYIVIDAGFLAISKDSPELNFGKVLAVSFD